MEKAANKNWLPGSFSWWFKIIPSKYKCNVGLKKWMKLISCHPHKKEDEEINLNITLQCRYFQKHVQYFLSWIFRGHSGLFFTWHTGQVGSVSVLVPSLSGLDSFLSLWDSGREMFVSEKLLICAVLSGMYLFEVWN